MISRTGVALVVSPLLASCVTSSIAADLDRVAALSDAPIPPELDRDPGMAEEVRDLLREPLTVDRAVRIAVANNRELRSELVGLGVARGELMQAGMLPNPVLELEALPERDTTLEVRVEYDLTELLLAPVQSEAAAADLEARRFRTARAVIDLGREVRAAFVALQAAEQRLAVAQRALDAFAASRDASVALLDAGNITPLEDARHVAAYERARVRVSELELAVAAGAERLQRLLGLHGEHTAWKLAGPMSTVPDEPPAAGELEARAVRASLVLAEVKAELEATAHRTGAARARGAVPELAVDVHALYGHPEEEASPDRLWRFGAGVSVALPFFDRGQGTTRALEARFDALEERHQGAAIALRSAVREAEARVRSAHARARHFQEVVVPAQARVTEHALLAYNAMQAGVFELLDARREQLDAELEQIGTLAEYWTAAAALDALLAGGSTTGMADGMSGAPIMNDGGAARGGH